MTLQDIYQELKVDLELIEKDLLEVVSENSVPVKNSIVELLQSGGKRIRPVLMLLSGQLGKYNIDDIKKTAVALELIHMATLIHDDVIDDAMIRRGKRTVKAQWDNRMAMYTGDFILSKAIQCVAKLKNVQIHQIVSKAIMQMCQGEIQQVQDLFRVNQSLKQYLLRIKRKTALLMAISCQLGALASQVDVGTTRKLYLYGYYAGLAFQITDDVLDLEGDEKLIGKPAGSDLKQGNITLPIIFTLNYAKEKEREKIATYITSKGNEESLPQILDLVRQLGGIEFALSVSRRYIDKAVSILDSLPDTKEKQLLYMILEFILDRSY